MLAIGIVMHFAGGVAEAEPLIVAVDLNAGEDFAVGGEDAAGDELLFDGQIGIEDRVDDVIDGRNRADGAEVGADAAAGLGNGVAFHAAQVGAAENFLAAGGVPFFADARGDFGDLFLRWRRHVEGDAGGFAQNVREFGVAAADRIHFAEGHFGGVARGAFWPCRAAASLSAPSLRFSSASMHGADVVLGADGGEQICGGGGSGGCVEAREAGSGGDADSGVICQRRPVAPGFSDSLRRRWRRERRCAAWRRWRCFCHSSPAC